MTIKDLNEYLSNFDWGYKINGENIFKNESKITDKMFADNYRTLSPMQFEIDKCGICWDYVNDEAIYFQKYFHMNCTLNNLSNNCFSQYYIETIPNNKTHTFIAYMENNMIHIFESSWKPFVGIYDFHSEKEMLNYYYKKFCNNNNVDKCSVFKYLPFTEFWLSPYEFIRIIKEKGKKISLQNI